MKVEATSRQLQGTGASRRLRRAGRVPAIVYGGADKPISIELDHNSIYHALRKEAFHSSLLDLEIDGKPAGLVLLRDFQWHAYKTLVMHVDFQRVDPNTKLHKKVPLHFVGEAESPAVKLSAAVISHIRTELDIKCLPKDLPEFIEVNLSSIKAGETLHVSQLTLPAGVETVLHPGEDPSIAAAVLPRGAIEAAAEEGAAAAAPAPAPAAKPAAKK